MNDQKDSVIKVLESYAYETPESVDRQAVLERYIKEFPQFTNELKSFAIERDLLKFSHLENISEAEKEEHRKASRETLRSFLERKGSTVAEEPEIKSLNLLAKSKGIKKIDLARRLGISISLLIYLEKRRLQLETIPQKFIKRIAEVLEQTENAIQAYLGQRADFATDASFKTEDRPQDIEQKSFTEAVRQDQTLSEKEKQELLKLMEN